MNAQVKPITEQTVTDAELEKQYPSPGIVPVRPWLRWTETHPDKLEAEERAMSREFANLGIDPQSAAYLASRSIWNATSGASTRERYAEQEKADAAMNQMTRGEWKAAKAEVAKWLQSRAPRVARMLKESGAGTDDSKAIREILTAWQRRPRG